MPKEEADPSQDNLLHNVYWVTMEFCCNRVVINCFIIVYMAPVVNSSEENYIF